MTLNVLYSPDVKVAEVVKRSVGRLKPFASSISATGFALIGADLTGATVEASTDGFSTIAYSNSVGDVTGNLLVTGINVAAASWRVQGSGQVGLLLPGAAIEIKNPAYPFRWHQDVFADDRTTLGGAQYSRIRRRQRTAEWRWDIGREAEVDRWRAWYDVTDGMRRAFVITDPLDNEPYLVKAPDRFPLTREEVGRWGGAVELSEVPIR